MKFLNVIPFIIILCVSILLGSMSVNKVICILKYYPGKDTVVSFTDGRYQIFGDPTHIDYQLCDLSNNNDFIDVGVKSYYKTKNYDYIKGDELTIIDVKNKSYKQYSYKNIPKNHLYTIKKGHFISVIGQ